jgi:hypothetical protein
VPHSSRPLRRVGAMIFSPEFLICALADVVLQKKLHCRIVQRFRLRFGCFIRGFATYSE